MENTSNSPNYRVILGDDFIKDLKRIIKSGDKRIKSRVIAIIEELKYEPHIKRPKVDIKLISRREEGIYRVRVGKYRMVFQIDETEKKVSATMIFLRGRGY